MIQLKETTSRVTSGESLDKWNKHNQSTAQGFWSRGCWFSSILHQMCQVVLQSPCTPSPLHLVVTMMCTHTEKIHTQTLQGIIYPHSPKKNVNFKLFVMAENVIQTLNKSQQISESCGPMKWFHTVVPRWPIQQETKPYQQEQKRPHPGLKGLSQVCRSLRMRGGLWSMPACTMTNHTAAATYHLHHPRAATPPPPTLIPHTLTS